MHLPTKPSTEKNQSSIEPKSLIEEEIDEEEDQEIDDQEEVLQIDRHFLEGTTTDIQKKNMITRPRMWGRKTFEKE